MVYLNNRYLLLFITNLKAILHKEFITYYNYISIGHLFTFYSSLMLLESDSFASVNYP